MSFPQLTDSVLALLDEHLVIKIGENKVSPHLHPPVHKEEPTIIAFRGHLLLVMGTAAQQPSVCLVISGEGWS